MYCYKNQLTKLTLANLPKLEYIEANDNQLADEGSSVGLEIINCPRVSLLWIGSNKLNKLDFLDGLNSESLNELSIRLNNFSPQDLETFARFKNLTNLWVNSNEFFGSLESLKNLNKLQDLNVSDTDIDDGLEYLPQSIQKFFVYCPPKEKKIANKEREVEKKIEKKLKDFVNNEEDEPKIDNDYRYPTPNIKNYFGLLEAWRKENKSEIKLILKTKELKAIRSEIKGFFKDWGVFIIKQKRLAEIETNSKKLTSWVTKSAKCASVAGAALAVAGTSTKDSNREASIVLTPLGGTLVGLGTTVDLFFPIILKKCCKKDKESLETEKENRMNDFLSKLQGLKDNYLELKEINEELKLKVDDDRLTALKDNLTKVNKSVDNLETNYTKINSPKERMTEKSAREFAQSFQEKWKTVSKSIKELGGKIEKERRQGSMYQANPEKNEPREENQHQTEQVTINITEGEIKAEEINLQNLGNEQVTQTQQNVYPSKK